MSLHPIMAAALAPHIPANTYRGWSISFDYPPILVRDFDWSATSPDYDVDGDSEGFHQCSGAIVHGATRGSVIEAVDAWYDENGEGR